MTCNQQQQRKVKIYKQYLKNNYTPSKSLGFFIVYKTQPFFKNHNFDEYIKMIKGYIPYYKDLYERIMKFVTLSRVTIW